jgi:hypothetical protein
MCQLLSVQQGQTGLADLVHDPRWSNEGLVWGDEGWDLLVGASAKLRCRRPDARPEVRPELSTAHDRGRPQSAGPASSPALSRVVADRL